jgi:GNAT superfamily N-acetyltransferase
MIRHTLTVEDINKVKNLVTKTNVFSAEEIEVAGELVEEALEKGSEKSGYNFIMLESENSSQLLGYACYGRIPISAHCFDLYWIVVDPSYQRNGYAKILLQQVDTAVKASNGSHLYAETSGLPSYEAARSFYLRNGFNEVARLEDFYKPGDAKVFFRRSYV